MGEIMLYIVLPIVVLVAGAALCLKHVRRQREER
jgi:cytochrome c-type biogenesis protein CcmH/NrfF